MMQQRYEIPNEQDPDDPLYKRLETLTAEELDWNIDRLARLAEEHLKHAKALEAYRDEKFGGPQTLKGNER